VGLLTAALAALSAVCAVGVWALLQVASALRREAAESRRNRTLAILRLFSTGQSASQEDPRALLTWQPLAMAARRLCPDEFAELDRAFGSEFPFSRDVIQAAHARWSAEWLAWERAHDNDYKLKAAELESELVPGAADLARSRLDAVEREKLERYQRRYAEYVQVSKALQALLS
jgi:hypothetical protein